MKKYLVKQGESLWQIAKEQKITLEALLASNPQISDINAVLAGDELNLPELPPPPSQPYVRNAQPDYQPLNQQAQHDQPYVRNAQPDYQPFNQQTQHDQPYVREAAAEYRPFSSQAQQAVPQDDYYWTHEPQQRQQQQQMQQQQQPQASQRAGFCPYCGAPLRPSRPFRRF